MNVAGRSLQDIYDAGSRRLDELEQSEKTSLGEGADAHLDDRAKIEPDSLKLLEDRTDELEEEIRGFLSRGIDRVQKTVESECQESERHTTRLVEGLVLVAKKFSESIAQLRRVAECQLTDQGEDCQHIYALHAQTACSELLHDATQAISESREESVQAEETVATQIEESWVSVYEAEGAALEQLEACFDKDGEQVNIRFSQARKSLEDRSNERLSQLQQRAKSSRDAIKALVDRVVEQTNRYAFDTDVKLKEGFSSQLYELSTSFDESATRSAGEISSLHESSMADLNMKSQELSREMDSLAEGMVKNARSKSQSLQDKGTSMLGGYTSDLNGKLEAGNLFHKELASERAQTVSEIWNELTELRQNFDDKLHSLASATLEKMRNICEEAETAIVSTQHTCCSDSKSNAALTQESIDAAARDFLRRVGENKKAALDGIAKAAGEDPSPASSSDSVVSKEESRRGGKSKDKPPRSDDGTASGAPSGESSESGEDEDGDASEDAHANPHPANDSDTESSGESRKRRNRKSDKRSPGDAKK